jgi:hypothetical protein
MDKNTKHLVEFKREYLERIVNGLCETGIQKFNLEFYSSNRTKPSEYKKNLNIKIADELIEQLRAKHVSITSIDTEKMNADQLTALFDRCVRWVQNPKYRNFPNLEVRYVSDLLWGIGKETPVLIARDTPSGELLFVFPHEVQSGHFSLIDMQGFVSREIITIFDFLAFLKQNLENR